VGLIDESVATVEMNVARDRDRPAVSQLFITNGVTSDFEENTTNSQAGANNFELQQTAQNLLGITNMPL
jgi:hypothetical protein